MFCENGRSIAAIHVLNCEKCVKVRRRETTWDRRDTPRAPAPRPRKAVAYVEVGPVDLPPVCKNTEGVAFMRSSMEEEL